MTTALEGIAPAPRKELKNHSTRRVVAIQGWASVLFGLPFLTAGVFIALLPTSVLGVQSDNMHAPPWVISAEGLATRLSERPAPLGARARAGNAGDRLRGDVPAARLRARASLGPVCKGARSSNHSIV
jgi:hypothetical protein